MDIGMKIANVIIVTLLTSLADASEIKPPQPDYKKYGSYSRQLTVYQNSRAELDRLEREKYRKFREEVKKATPERPTPTYIIVRTNTNCQTQK